MRKLNKIVCSGLLKGAGQLASRLIGGLAGRAGGRGGLQGPWGENGHFLPAMPDICPYSEAGTQSLHSTVRIKPKKCWNPT